MLNKMNRRDFLKGCASFSAFASLRGFGITNMLFQSVTTTPQTTLQALPDRALLVYVFVRGGLDGLNLVAPFNTSQADHDAYYTKLRPKLAIPAPDRSAGRNLVDLDGQFGLHPDAARGATAVNVPNPQPSDTGGLHKIFQNGDLAVVHAVGSPDATGSHFDTELYVDLGRTTGETGWLTRYLNAIGAPADTLVVAPQRVVPMSLAGLFSAVAMPRPNSFGPEWPNADDTYRQALIKQQQELLEPMFQHEKNFINVIGQRAFGALNVLAPVLSATYTPAATYLTDEKVTPDTGGFGQAMQTIARIAKANLTQPLRVACVDVGGGYDTHDNQGTVDWAANPRYPQLIANLATNLKAFYDDMNSDAAWRGHFTVVVLSEFGRVLYENNSGGCDHGSGNVMLVVGSQGAIQGGKVYTNWPGLQTLGFNDGLQITTDYRLVLADVLVNRLGVTKAQINETIFPGLTFSNLLGIARPMVTGPQDHQVCLPIVMR